LFYDQTYNGVNLYTKKQKSFWVNFKGDQKSLKVYAQSILIKISILFLVILFLNFFQNQIRNSFLSLSSPLSAVFLKSGANLGSAFGSFFNSTDIVNQNADLKEENYNLLAKIALLQDNLKQSHEFNSMSGTLIKNNFEAILVKVVGLSWANDSIIIDKGFENGILENMPIISKENVIYGRVINVYKNFSQVSLISASNNIFNVKIQPDDPTKEVVYGVVRGEGNMNIFLDLVDSDSQINEGDILVTSGLEGFFPKDMLVGKITTVNKSDLEPFQTAEIQPFFHVNNIENLFIIKNYLK